MDIATTATTTGEILHWISQYGYIILLPLFIIEGPVVGLASGVLVSLGILNFFPVLILYISGTLISDSVLYFLSRYADKYLTKIPLGKRAMLRVNRVLDDSGENWRQQFNTNYFSLMMFAKLLPVNLISEMVVLIAGAIKMSVKKFYAPILVAQPIWSISILSIGYYFGDVIINPEQIFEKITLIVIIIAGLFILYRWYIRSYTITTRSLLNRISRGGQIDE